jgi:hypothetical protein
MNTRDRVLEAEASSLLQAVDYRRSYVLCLRVAEPDPHTY